MKKSIFLVLSLFVFFACSKKEDLFDHGRIDEEAKENFPVKDIDPNHDWEMAGVGTMTVSVNDGTGQTYKIQVCTDNPLNLENNARLLSEQSIKDGESKSFTFDMPTSTEFVYVVKQTADYTRSAILVLGEKGKFRLELGKTNKGRSIAYSQAKAVVVNYPTISFDLPNNIRRVSVEENAWGKKVINVSGNCYIDSDVTCDNIIFSQKAHLYIKGGTVKVKEGQDRYLVLNANQYLSVLAGAKLKCETKLGISLSGGNIYCQSGSRIEIDNEDDGLDDKIYQTSGIIMNSNSFLYNEGLIKVKKEHISISAAMFVNAEGGELDSDEIDLVVSPTGTFYNSPSSVVKVEDVNIDGKWLNEGEFEAEDFTINGSNYEIQNSCKLNVEEFKLNTDVKFYNSGYVKCKEAEFGSGTILMASKALFKVSEEAEFYSNFTIEGPNSGEAVLIMDEAKLASNSGNNNWYKGNLTVVCDEYFEKYDTHPGRPQPSNWEIYNSETKKIDISETKCSDGYHQDVTPSEPTPSQVYTYVYEDMTREVGDFDFNDVVLKVTTPDTDGYINVTLYAAGAAKDLWVGFNGPEEKRNDLFGEVHKAMGCPSGTLINTGSGPSGTPKTVQVKLGVDRTLKEYGNFYIYDENKLSIYIASLNRPKSEYPPYGLCIPIDWPYPNERVPITSKYRYFENWVNNQNTYKRWYEEGMTEYKDAWDIEEGYPYDDK